MDKLLCGVDLEKLLMFKKQKEKTFSSNGGEVHQDRDFGENHIILFNPMLTNMAFIDME